MPFEPKYDVTMSEQYRLRLTPEQKELIFTVAPDKRVAEFWRNFCVSVARKLGEIKAGTLSPEEFGAYMQEFADIYRQVSTGEAYTDEETKALFDALSDTDSV